MKFPITRESLQAFDYAKEQEELREEAVQKRLAEILEQLCAEFKKSMPSNSKEKRFVWHKIYNRIQIEYLSLLIDKVKEVFIGCNIIIDPLKTYLIIDWS
jgi:hypothetical protein